jgi:hypothetical protein
MNIIIENLQTNKETGLSCTPYDMDKAVSAVIGAEVECLDESNGWFYFWAKDADTNNDDAVAIARTEVE